MTAPRVVGVERHGNVVQLTFFPVDTQRPAVLGKNPPAAGPLPARLNPRPVRTVARRVARSQAAADLRDAGFVIGLLVAALICLIWFDPTPQDLAHLINGDPR